MVCLHLSHPFYTAHDMDFITLIDTLSMNSGYPPIHLAHPGRGMHFIYHWAERIFSFTSLSPLLTFSHLDNSLEPMLVVANKVVFLRLINLGVLVSTGILFLLAIHKICKKPLFLISGILFCFSVQGFWNFNLNLIRTENFSIFFLSVAFFLMSDKLSREDKKGNLIDYFIIFIFLALSYVTKIQALFVVSAFAVMAAPNLKDLLPKGSYSVKTFRWLLLFYLSLLVAVFFFIEIDSETFVKRYSLNKTAGIPMLLSMIFLCFPKNPTRHRFWGYMRHYLAPLVSMAFISLICAMLIVSTTATDLGGFIHQFLSYFKLIFSRVSIFEGYHYKFIYSQYNLLWNWNTYYPYLIASLALVITNVFYSCRCCNFKSAMGILVIFMLLLLNVIIGTRSSLQDTIWNQLFFSAFILASLCFFLVSLGTQKLAKAASLLVFSTSVFVFYKNLFVFGMPYSHYYDYDRYFEPAHYGIERSSPYGKTMSLRYSDAEKKRFLKGRLLRPFHYALSLQWHFPKSRYSPWKQGEFSIFDVSIPHKGSFWVREPDGGKAFLDAKCPRSVCDGNSYAVSSTKRQGTISINKKRDSKVYAVSTLKVGNDKCRKFITETEGVFFYETLCSGYGLDDGHRAFIVSENS